MNTKFLPLIVIGAIAVIALGGFLFMNQNKQSSPTTETEQTQTQGANSLKELLSGNASQECTFTDNEAGSTGVVFVADKKMKGDFTTTVEGETNKSHVIVDNNVMYTWTSDSNTGFKFTFDPEDVEEAREQAEQGAFDLNREVDFSCKPWNPDQNTFTPPTDVTFQDLSDFSSGMPVQGTDTKDRSVEGANCSSCNYLSGEAKMNCLDVLKC
jgi:hypothetical protein